MTSAAGSDLSYPLSVVPGYSMVQQKYPHHLCISTGCGLKNVSICIEDLWLDAIKFTDLLSEKTLPSMVFLNRDYHPPTLGQSFDPPS